MSARKPRGSGAMALCCALSVLLGCAHEATIHAGSSGLARGEKELLSRLARAKQTPRLALAIAITDSSPRELWAYDLEQRRVRFRTQLPDGKTSRPDLHGDRIVLRIEDTLRSFDVTEGRELASTDLEAGLYAGAALDGDALAVVLRDESAQRSTLRILSADTLALRHEHALHGEAGSPVAIAGMFVVPFQHQSLLAFDARSGALLHVLRSRDDSIEWLSAAEHSLLFGGNAVYRLGPEAYSGSRASAVLEHRPRFEPKLPVPVSAPASAYAIHAGEHSAEGRVGLRLEHAASKRSVVLRGGRQYFVFHRHVFGFDAGGQLLFARRLGADVVASRVLDRSLLVATERGELLWLHKDTGTTVAEVALGTELASIALPAVDAAAESTSAPADALVQGLLAVARDPDNRLVPSRAFAVQSLARRPEAFLTAELLALYEQPSTPPELQSVLAEALHARERGLDALLAALRQRYDFIEGTRAAPLSVVVPPLVAANERRALPALIEHLEDPATPVRSLPVLVEALEKLGDASIVTPLLAFVQRYRADDTLAAAPETIERAARALLRHGDQTTRAVLASISQHPRTRQAYRAELAALLAPPAAPEEAPQAEVRVAEVAPKLPSSVSQAAIDRAFAPHLGALLACAGGLLERHPKLREARIAFVLEGDGSAHAVHVVPAHDAFEACAYPAIRAIAFPQHAKSRVLARYALPLRERARPEAPAKSEQTEAFWALAAKQPRAVKADVTPWWQSQQPLVRWLEQPAQQAPRPSTAAQQHVPAAARAPTPSASPSVVPREGTAIGASPAQSPTAAQPSTASEPEPASDAWWIPEQPAAPASPPP